MANKLYKEDERLRTFLSWNYGYINKHVLAATGMYYTGFTDLVKCYFCKVIIGEWELDDHPVIEHFKLSPNCHLLNQRTTNNVPINPTDLARIIAEIGDYINEFNNERFGSAADQAVVTPSAPLPNGHPIPNINTSNTPEYPEYASESVRFHSYEGWPRNMRQQSAELAEAGFFYTGISDIVVCFSCGGELREWQDTDLVWQEHARWFSSCHYLLIMKGQIFIQDVISKFNNPAANGAYGNSVASKQTTNVAATQDEPSCSRTTSAAARSLWRNTFENSNELKYTTHNIGKQLSQGVSDEKLCKICFTADYDTAFIPCGHVMSCHKCSSTIFTCPICRESKFDSIRLYFC